MAIQRRVGGLPCLVVNTADTIPETPALSSVVCDRRIVGFVRPFDRKQRVGSGQNPCCGSQVYHIDGPELYLFNVTCAPYAYELLLDGPQSNEPTAATAPQLRETIAQSRIAIRLSPRGTRATRIATWRWKFAGFLPDEQPSFNGIRHLHALLQKGRLAMMKQTSRAYRAP